MALLLRPLRAFALLLAALVLGLLAAQATAEAGRDAEPAASPTGAGLWESLRVPSSHSAPGTTESGNANATQDCCPRVLPGPQRFPRIMHNQLTSYRIQGPQMGCQLEAIVLVTKKGRQLCISPDAYRVPEIMRKIDARNQKAEANRQGV